MADNKNEFWPWDSEEEKEQYFEIMDEHYEDIAAQQKEYQQKTDDILNEIKSLKSTEWMEELLQYAKDSEIHNPFEIVTKPKGQWQEESEYPTLGGVWVDQSSSYGCEDCYYGTVTVKVDENKYLEMPFAC